jgi:hypothetical protein
VVRHADKGQRSRTREGVSEGSSLCICDAPRRQRSKIEDEDEFEMSEMVRQQFLQIYSQFY